MVDRDETPVATATNESERAGSLQGYDAILIGTLPVISFISLPAALPRIAEHFSYVPDVKFLVPIIVTAPALCMALLSPFAGALADRAGRRGITLTALTLYVISGSAPLIIDNLWAIIWSRIALGVANAALVTMSVTLLGDYFKDHRCRRWFAIKGMVNPVLATLSLLAGGILADFSWRAPFLLSAFGLIVLILSYIGIWEPVRILRSSEAELAAGFPWKSLSFVYIASFIVANIYYVQPIYMGLLLHQLGANSSTLIAILTSLGSIGVFLGAAIYGQISAASNSRLLALSMVLFGIGLTGLGFSTTYIAAAFAAFPQQLGAGMVEPVLWTWCESKLSLHLRGRAMGFLQTSFYAGQFTSPILTGGLIAGFGGLRPTFVLVGVAAFGCAAAVSFVRDRRRARVSTE